MTVFASVLHIFGSRRRCYQKNLSQAWQFLKPFIMVQVCVAYIIVFEGRLMIFIYHLLNLFAFDWSHLYLLDSMLNLKVSQMIYQQLLGYVQLLLQK